MPTQDYTSSWTDALTTVRAAIISGIETDYAAVFGTKPEADRDAHLDFIPPQVNVWGVFSGGGGSEQVQTFDEAPPGELVLTARVEGRFNTREDARSFTMMVLSALPVRQDGNVQWFRITNEPKIEQERIRLANDRTRKIYWKATIPCLLVFQTAEAV